MKKQNRTRLFAYSLILLLAALPFSASGEIHLVQNNLQPYGKTASSESVIFTSVDNEIIKVPGIKKTWSLADGTEEESGVFTLNLSLFCNPDTNMADQIFIIDSENSRIYRSIFADEYIPEEYDGTLTVTTEVEPGTYDIIAIYSGSEGTYAVIRELVKVDTDMDINLSIQEATSKITFNSELTDGSEMVLDHMIFNTFFGDEEHAEVIEGNVDRILASSGLCVDGIPAPFYVCMAEAENTYEYFGTVIDLVKMLDWYTTPGLSNRFTFMETRNVWADNVPYSILYSAGANYDGELIADKSTYRAYTETYTPTPLLQTALSEGEDAPFMGYKSYNLNSGKNFSADMSYTDVHVDNQITLNTALVKDDENDTRYSQLFLANFIEYIDFETYDFPSINCTPARFDNNGDIEYISCDIFFMNEPADGFYTYYPGYEPYSFNIGQKKVEFGETAPLNSIYFNNREFKGKKMCYGYNARPRGILGEIRLSDLYSMTMEATLDGEPTELKELSDGIYEVTITNSNIVVDGMEGKSVTRTTFDASQDDYFPPVYTMLQMRDCENNVTNRFTSSSDGSISFTAADIQYNYDIYALNHLPLKEVRIEYSVHGTDEWTNIDVEECPEYASTDNYGYYYSCTLDEIVVENPNTWYDIRLFISDSAGNTQEQLISPAFMIMNPTSHLILNEYDSTNPVEYFNIQGIRIPEPTTGLNIIRYSDGTVGKVVYPNN